MAFGKLQTDGRGCVESVTSVSCSAKVTLPVDLDVDGGQLVVWACKGVIVTACVSPGFLTDSATLNYNNQCDRFRCKVLLIILHCTCFLHYKSYIHTCYLWGHSGKSDLSVTSEIKV